VASHAALAAGGSEVRGAEDQRAAVEAGNTTARHDGAGLHGVTPQSGERQ
jgi:hypothetical protein